MRHVYDCQMRWADMDMLGHVNNVSYLQYTEEARLDLFEELGLAAPSGLPAPGGPGIRDHRGGAVVVARYAVGFRAPLVYRGGAVRVECWVADLGVDEATLAFEIVAGPEHEDQERAVCFTQTSVVAPYDGERRRDWTEEERAGLATYLEEGPRTSRDPLPGLPRGGTGFETALHTRYGDLDTRGLVGGVRLLELFQEARIRYLVTLPRPEDGPWSAWVVASIEVERLRPVPPRRQPYLVTTWTESVGNTSAVLCSQLSDGGTALARCKAVLVGFDAEAQKAAPMNPAQRQRLVDAADAAHGRG